MIRVVLFDFIGTTVFEKNPDIINDCFSEAFADSDIIVDKADIIKNRGKDKRETINEILNLQKKSLYLAERIYSGFQIKLETNLSNFEENPDLLEILHFLNDNNIKAGIGTGLPDDVFLKIIAYLKWDNSYFDYIGTSTRIGRSRPAPDMIFDMMNTLNLTCPEEILKVGDTIVDIQEGKNARCKTAVLLSGTQDEQALSEAKPDYILGRLTDIQQIV